MTSIKERERTVSVETHRPSFSEYALYAGLVALVVGAAIVFAVVRGGEEAPSTAVEPADVVESGVLNTEPWGSPNSELLEEILNPPEAAPPAVTAAPSEVIMVEIGGFAIAEPWGRPDPELLASILDPEGTAFRAMEPEGEPNTALLESILDPEGAAFRAMEPEGEPDTALLESTLDPVGAAFRAMEPTGRPDYQRLSSIVGAPYAEQVAGPR